MTTHRRPRRATVLFTTTPPSERVSGLAVSGLRIFAGLIWLYNVVWKVPPDFGENSRSALYQFTNFAVDHPVFPPFSWVIEHVVLPNFTAFGWLTLIVETALAVLLLTGTAVRVAALIGVIQSVAIGLSVAEAPGEWPWAYAMMIAIHLVLLLTPSGQFAAVDAARSDRNAAKRLLIGWGVALALVGVVALIGAVGEDARAPLGALVGIQALEFSLGNYNLIGAVVLLAVAALLLTGAVLRRPLLTSAGAVLAVAAAVLIYVQLGRTDSWLGATGTSAAVFLCAAVVSAVTSRPMKGT